MGLEDRDYLKDEAARYSGGGFGGGGGRSFGAESPMCRNILIVTIVVFLMQMFSARGWKDEELLAIHAQKLTNLKAMIDEQQAYGEVDPALQREYNRLHNIGTPTAANLDLPSTPGSSGGELLRMEPPKVMHGQIWRLLTYAFCHDRLWLGHILFNMIGLWIFGRRLEAMYGSREFLLFYLSGAVVAGLAYMALDLVSGNPAPMLGASGAVMALLTLYAVHFPTQTIYLMLIIPIEVRWLVLIYAIYDLHPLLMRAAGEPAYDQVAHAAHLGGMAFGYWYAKRSFRLDRYWSGLSTWWKARRRGFKVVSSDSSPGHSAKSQKLADEMDAILKKISEQGEASLSKAERKTLEKASRELRDRNR